MLIRLLPSLFFAFFIVASIGCKNKKQEGKEGENLIFNFFSQEEQEKKMENTYFSINASTNLQAPLPLKKNYPVVFQSLQESFKKFQIKKGNNNEIRVVQDKSIGSEKPKSYFEIHIGSKEIIIKAGTEEGILNGLTRLENEIKTQNGKLITEKIADWSKIDIRVLHMAIWGGSDLIKMKQLIDLARKNHFNTLIVSINGQVNLKSIKQTEDARRWSQQRFKEFINYAKQSGLEVIPEIKLLSHQKKRSLGHAYPQYLLNKTTYNPNAEGLYTEVVFPLIKEILRLTGASKLHIGHDEVAGHTGYKKDFLRIGKGKPVLSSSLFLKDVVKVDSFLNARNVQTLMWGDMLLNPAKFTKMRKAVLNGIAGYDELITQLPKDIIICDWHYKDKQKEFPSYTYLAKHGFEVWGATWDREETTKNFTNYVADSNVQPKARIATTWYGTPKFDIIKEIIVTSGQIFWNAK